MNYEDEIQSVIISHLIEQYGIQDETALFHYLIIRSYIKRNGKEFTKRRETEEFVQFICEELNLPKGDMFVYKNQCISKGIAHINSLENIIESWKFECAIRPIVNEKGVTLSIEDYIKKQKAKIHRYAVNKSKSFKKNSAYEWHWKYHALKHLNSVYDVTLSNPKQIAGVYYGEEHEIHERTMEETIDAWMHVNTYERIDTKTIDEQTVEKYIYPRLHLVEDGLTYVDRQVVIPDGRIDILAKDKNGIYVIIELKVVEDKELVWQCMYYPMQIKKMYGASEVRMMTIAPNYSNSLKTTLDEIGYVEMMTFIPKVRLGKIESITINQLFDDVAA